MEKRAVHFIASRTKNYADKRELMNMVNELLGIQYNIAKANRTDRKVQNLAAYINADTLRAIHKTMDRKKAYGIDKVTKEDYEKNLEENLANLVKRMKNGSYRPNPTRRVYIPKETKGKMRPLGISCYEDKLVENAIAQILEQIYEPKFYNESFGFRPNRNCHQAFPGRLRPRAVSAGSRRAFCPDRFFRLFLPVHQAFGVFAHPQRARGVYSLQYFSNCGTGGCGTCVTAFMRFMSLRYFM